MYDSTKAIDTKQTVRVTVTTPHTTETPDDRPASIADVSHLPMEVSDDTPRVPHTDDYTREHTSRVKLPKLTPKKFSGELTR